ncbi:MAG TPA: hypothetical protein VMR17_00875 [Xanthobacteraceae bacterium]|nr:hypothetical protein [Xanthobacteraceae bacterium]
MLGPFHRQHARHPDQRRLGYAVGRTLDRADEAMGRSDVDDAAATAGGDQMPADLLGQEKRAPDVHRHERVPLRCRDLGGELVQVGAGIVDQHIELAERRNGLGRRPRDAGLVAQIERERDGARARGLEFFHRVGQVRHIGCGDGDSEAVTCQRQSGRRADAVGCARHQRRPFRRHHGLRVVMAGLVPAIHDLASPLHLRRGCPRHRRAKRRRSSNGYARA